MRILYVENHTVFAEQVCQQFLSGHCVQVVSNLVAARAALAAGAYDLLIVDYDLDDGKGDELVRSCRVLHLNMKIIAASAHESGNIALSKAGASAICGKLEFDKIESVISRLFI